jgi:hypothetical protein
MEEQGAHLELDWVVCLALHVVTTTNSSTTASCTCVMDASSVMQCAR